MAKCNHPVPFQSVACLESLATGTSVDMQRKAEQSKLEGLV